MYATCLFCHTGLGRNEIVETFPVGRRIAFDPAKGRLWAVCRRCRRWNLSPIEERWEAVEECERLFRSTKLRVSTDNVGLARVAEGTDLVRVGDPQRPELAAWRYGDQFGRRRRRSLLQTAVSVAILVPGMTTGMLPAIAAALPGGAFLMQVPSWVQIYNRRRRIIARAQLGADRYVPVRGKHLRAASLVPSTAGGSEWGLGLQHDQGEADLTGPEAIRVAGLLLSRMNQAGAGARNVRTAVHRLEESGGTAQVFTDVAAAAALADAPRWSYATGMIGRTESPLQSLPVSDRLALEMAANEESERAALEGELATLEAAWREAEEIASIADDLVVPPEIHQALRARTR